MGPDNQIVECLTVCVITYNHEDSIVRCLDSICKQETDFHFVVNIVDDASTDDTVARIQEYAKGKGLQLRLYTNEHNIGPDASWRRLMSLIETDYFAYIEGDDYWCDSKMLDNQYSPLIEDTSFDYCGARFVAVDSCGQELGRQPMLSKEKYSPVAKYSLIKLSTIVMKTSVINEIIQFAGSKEINEYIINNILFESYKGLRYNSFVTTYVISGRGVWTSASTTRKLIAHFSDVKWLRRCLRRQWSFYVTQEIVTIIILLHNQSTRQATIVDLKNNYLEYSRVLLRYFVCAGVISSLPSVARWFKDKRSMPYL